MLRLEGVFAPVPTAFDQDGRKNKRDHNRGHVQIRTRHDELTGGGQVIKWRGGDGFRNVQPQQRYEFSEVR
jgi:hypothetical protein